ncbi:MAG: aldehyde dehydrogenase (NADP(+)) [Roseinatronobacter sp.]|nr:aldehyde dehydrogenase (NADP(+)) [Roseinatronobacter sp.]
MLPAAKTPHLIAGQWVSAGPGAQDVDRACHVAEEAFSSYGWTSASARAQLLHAIADAIEVRRAEIVEICTQETALPAARIAGEIGRTSGQFRLFAAHLLGGTALEYRHDPALPDRQPLPRPDLQMIQRPIGPVAVFGASNFPLAFSTGGGDTAAALAAGCPVVVKGHPAHPGTSRLVAEAIRDALAACGHSPGVFGMVQDGSPESGAALVQHPAIQAVGFTGSHRVGRILFDLCAARPVPIPFFGELGAINPVFILPDRVQQGGAELAQAWAASLALGVGQFCTNPGLLVLPRGAAGGQFLDAACAALAQIVPQTMLTTAIAEGARTGCATLAALPGVEIVLAPSGAGREMGPALYAASIEDFLATPAMAQEVFGPVGLVLWADTAAQMATLARTMPGQLTATVHMADTPADTQSARLLLPLLERKAGRVLFNGFPTGVEVAEAMVHGGPYPASTNFGATSVGTLAIRRFLRPVCYQNLPEGLRPAVPGLPQGE